jgi:integrase
MRLRWADVDPEQGLIRVVESKSHKTRYVPINATLQAVLEAIDVFTGEKGPSPCVFTNPAPGTRCEDVSRTFSSRMARLGIPLKAIQELPGQGRTPW